MPSGHKDHNLVTGDCMLENRGDNAHSVLIFAKAGRWLDGRSCETPFSCTDKSKEIAKEPNRRKSDTNQGLGLGPWPVIEP